MQHPALPPPRRWPIFLPTAIVVVLAVAWTGFWFYAAARAQQTLEGWRAREAKAGRIFSCSSQSIGGFPFRIEVRCADPGAEVRSNQPPLTLRAHDLLVASQVYQPTLLIGEFTGPITIGEAGKPATIVGNWKLAQSSVRGTPLEPERVALVLEEPHFERGPAPAAQTLLQAKEIELHGRMIAGSARADPVIELALRLVAASSPAYAKHGTQPLDAEIVGVLRGLKDFSAKPWSARLRELQARGGKFEIERARVHQGEVIATASGTLSLSPRGRLDGELRANIAGIEKLLAALGVDRPPAAGQPDALAPAVEALNRIAPGLGDLARRHAGTTIAAGLGLLGQSTTLEGRPAVSVPLRFADGAVFLGPLKVGETPPLY
jgi:hypothetical protein